MTFEYKSNNMEIKTVNEKCDLGVGFDNRLKAENHILSFGSRTNRIICWMSKMLF